MSWIIWLLAVTHYGVLSTPVLDLYGCRYVDLCPVGSGCIDDSLFGHCGDLSQPRFQFGFKLNPEQVTKLSFIVNDLLTARQTWTDRSTQTVMNKFLAPVRQFTNPYLRQENEAIAAQISSGEILKREDWLQYQQRPTGKTLQWPPQKPLTGEKERIKEAPSPLTTEELYPSPAFTFKQRSNNGLLQEEPLDGTGIKDELETEQMTNAEKLLDYLSNFHSTATEVNDFVDRYLERDIASEYGSLGANADEDRVVPVDLYYMLYEYIPPNQGQTMGVEYLPFEYQYQYLNPANTADTAAASAYDFVYPLYPAAARTKPDYASLDFEYFEDFVPTEANTMKEPLKRESTSNKKEDEDHAKEPNTEYVQESKDEDFPSSIEHLEDEYREYIDSKYANEEEKLKPMERFTISKSKQTDDSNSEADENKMYSESYDGTADEAPEEKAADVLKREQVTLYDENYNGGDGFPDLSAQTYSLPAVDPNFCFVQTEQPLTYEQGNNLMMAIMNLTSITLSSYNHISFDGRKVTFFVQPGQNVNATEVARKIMSNKDNIKKKTGIKIESTGIGSEENERIMFTSTLAEEKSELALICVALLGCIVGLLSGVLGILALKNSKKKKNKADKLNAALSGDNGPTGTRDFPAVDYQELCREHKAVSKKSSGVEEVHRKKSGSIASTGQPCGVNERMGSESSEQSDRASVSSWSDDPASANLDITTGHLVLAYMESRLHDKSQLDAEWEALCAYEPEEVSFAKATCVANQDKNRFPTSLPFDHNCVALNPDTSQGYGDYINASAIRDMHPERAAYILAQAPLENTIGDFWQMVWEQRCTVAVLFAGPFDSFSLLTADGLPQFWPAEGNAVYHNFEVHLVSEHVWCGEYLVRSLYLKNLLTSQTRTVTLFHYLLWQPHKTPETGPRPLLEFRRKVNKAYKGKCSPIITMCGSGCDQSACYVLIDLVLNKIYRGAKEIDISATLEHLRDQRCGSVATKEQFEFCLTTVAEEVNGILKSIEPSAANGGATAPSHTGSTTGANPVAATNAYP